MQPTAYLSAEIGFSEHVPTYSGGLGVLAGDHLKAAADAGLPVVGVTLLYRQGYFRQHLRADGWQQASYPEFSPTPLLERLAEPVSVRLEGRTVHVAVWRYHLRGHNGAQLPILFLDTALDSNQAEDRTISQRLYGGDQRMRIRQEVVLGFGAVAAIRRYYPNIERLHLNEGHCAFAPLALLVGGKTVEEIKARVHFTTHTPVPAGHDVFPYPLAQEVLGDAMPATIRELAGPEALSMTELALSLSRSANAVSKLHGEVTREMFPNRDVGYVTNGVHHLTWVSHPMATLFDAQLPGWREDPTKLREAAKMSDDALWRAHSEQKNELLRYVNAQTGKGFAPEVLTIGFARRAAAYKRADLIFRDLERLVALGEGKVQFVFAGKAHPRDEAGHRIIQAVMHAAEKLAPRVRVGFVENYNMWSGALITSGVDVWLNNPRRPHEASGTSGMKATLNGVPNLSILDGWWAEGCRDGENGWAIGDEREHDDAEDMQFLYGTLEERVIPVFYQDRAAWLRIMKEAIRTGVDFTAHRMLHEYVERYYR